MVQASGVDTLAERYLEMILPETEYAVPSGGLKAQAIAYGGLRRGVARDEFWRSAGQFKMFGLSVAMLQGQRIANEIIANGGLRGAGYAAGLLITTTLYGALAIQLKEIGKGRDARPVDDAKFWGHAVLQSGGLGIYGDFLFAETNRMGGGLAPWSGRPPTSLPACWRSGRATWPNGCAARQPTPAGSWCDSSVRTRRAARTGICGWPMSACCSTICSASPTRRRMPPSGARCRCSGGTMAMSSSGRQVRARRGGRRHC
jgi:hypothetical protein